MASIQKFKPMDGWRIRWCLYLPDGTMKEKFKASASKGFLQEILPDIIKIESMSRRLELTGQDLVRALNLRIITREEVSLFSPGLGGNPIPHYLDDLRLDFEIQSRTRSASPHCHRANLSKANILDEYFKGIPVQNITPEEIERFRHQRKKSVCNTTVNHDVKVLRRFLDIAVNRGLIKGNPARQISLLGEPRNRIPRCLYPDELRRFAEGLKQHKHLLRGEIVFIVKFLVLTGLRRGELCNLKPDNINLLARQIRLIGKGGKARIVGIHRALLEDLRERLAKGYIIEGPIDPASITHAFKRVCRSVGLPENINLHSLRHTYISYLLDRGVPPVTVRERAGHFSLAITDKYAHALPSTTVPEDIIDIEEFIS